MKRLMVDGLRFVNEDGDQVLMNGINLVCKKKEYGYIEPNIDNLLIHFARRGFNLVRLGIFWDGVEPEPGVYDETYLDRVAHVVQKAEECGIYIMLDMHQDLFAAKFADGAPDWATLDEGLYHPEHCSMWYEAYLSSQAIMRAADNFWSNKEAADGVGLLDHYEAMWEHIADRFKDFTNMIGFEPMNEPYMGSIALRAFGTAIAKIKESNPDFDLSNQAAVTLEEQGVMQNILTEQFMDFDKEILIPFYNRILRAIRKVCSVPLVTGGNIYSSSFVETGIEKLTGPDGQVDHQQIYGPHGYDAVVDSDNYEAFNKENINQIFAQKNLSQLRLQVPVIVGEWGAFPSKDFTNSLIEHMAGILEQYHWSSTYWVYYQGMEKDPNYSSLERGYPVITAGDLISYQYDYSMKSLNVKWKAKKNRKTVLYIPELANITPKTIFVSIPAEVQIQPLSGVAGGYVTIVTDADELIEVTVR
jgi:endoglycosylceramidase